MNAATAIALVQHMAQRFEEYAGMAEKLDSPNPEDTLPIKCGIVAFSLITDSDKWTQDEYEFVKERLDDVPESLSEKVVKLKAMCLGAMCALRLEGKMNNEKFAVANAQLPGLIEAVEP